MKFKPNITRLYPQKQMPRPSIWDLANQQLRGRSGVSNDESVQALLDVASAAGETVAHGAALTALNTYVSGLKSSGIWDKLDRLSVFATNGDSDFALRDIKNPSTVCSAVNSPTFTSLEGFTGNASTSYINSNYNPTTDASVFTQNSASFGLYFRTTINSQAGGNGVFLGGGGALYISNTVSNEITINANDLVSSPLAIGDLNRTGLIIANRSGASARQVLYNGSTLTSDTEASMTINNGDVYILARNNQSAGLGQYSSVQVSIFFIGSSLLTDNSTINTLTEAYMDAIGKGVQ